MLLAGCTANPPSLPVLFNSGGGNKAVASYALSLKGTPYRYGKDSPKEGFDCSGFVRHVYQRQGISLPRTAKAMAETLPASCRMIRYWQGICCFLTLKVGGIHTLAFILTVASLSMRPANEADG